MKLFSFLSSGAWHRACGWRLSAVRVRPNVESLECRALLSVTLIDNHIDMGVDYRQGAFHLDIREQDNVIRYGPDAVLQYLDDNSLDSQPADPRYDFIGAGAGNPVWIIPINRVPNRLYTGFSAEGLQPGTFDTYFESDPRINRSGEYVTLNLIDVRSPDGGDAPGNFSLFQTSISGDPIVWYSTFNNPNSNAFFLQPGSHIHTFWGFTAPGRYDIDVQASAFIGGNLVQSHTVTWHFGVDDYTDFPPPPGAGPHDTGKTSHLQPVAAEVTLLPNQLVTPHTLVVQPVTLSPFSASVTLGQADPNPWDADLSHAALSDQVFANVGTDQTPALVGRTVRMSAGHVLELETPVIDPVLTTIALRSAGAPPVRLS